MKTFRYPYDMVLEAHCLYVKDVIIKPLSYNL